MLNGWIPPFNCNDAAFRRSVNWESLRWLSPFDEFVHCPRILLSKDLAKYNSPLALQQLLTFQVFCSPIQWYTLTYQCIVSIWTNNVYHCTTYTKIGYVAISMFVGFTDPLMLLLQRHVSRGVSLRAQRCMSALTSTVWIHPLHQEPGRPAMGAFCTMRWRIGLLIDLQSWLGCGLIFFFFFFFYELFLLYLSCMVLDSRKWLQSFGSGVDFENSSGSRDCKIIIKFFVWERWLSLNWTLQSSIQTGNVRICLLWWVASWTRTWQQFSLGHQEPWWRYVV